MGAFSRLKDSVCPTAILEGPLPADSIDRFKLLITTKEARALLDWENREITRLRRTPEVKDFLRRLRLKVYKEE